MYRDSVRASGHKGQAQDGCRSQGQCDAHAERGTGLSAFSGKEEGRMEPLRTFATRLYPDEADKLARLAARTGLSRSEVLRTLITKATEADVRVPTGLGRRGTQDEPERTGSAY